MKIETFVKGSLVAVLVFIAGLTILGEGILQQKFGVEDSPLDNFSRINSYQDNIKSLEVTMSGETLETSEVAEVEDSSNTGDFIWWTYTTSALRAVKSTVFSVDKSKGAISEIGDYLYVNPIISGGLISFLILSFVFSLISFWKSRRA